MSSPAKNREQATVAKSEAAADVRRSDVDVGRETNVEDLTKRSSEEKLPQPPPSSSSSSERKKSADFVNVNPKWKTPPTPNLDVRPVVLAAHLVPSLPIGLFELIAEVIEAATERPVSLVYEARRDRPVAKEVVDLAFLPAYEEWDDAELLPVTFVFAHRLNDSASGNVYVDVIVATDRAAHIESIMDLRGHRCALPDRHRRRGAAALLLGDLRSKGEGPAFFGNTLDSSSQLETLQMVAGRQAEVGVLEGPVLRYQRRKIPGAESLSILGSLGPLPPYAIYAKKSISGELKKNIASCLLDVKKDKHWAERFSVYGVEGFTSNSADAYVTNEDDKEVVTSVRYY